MYQKCNGATLIIKIGAAPMPPINNWIPQRREIQRFGVWKRLVHLWRISLCDSRFLCGEISNDASPWSTANSKITAYTNFLSFWFRWESSWRAWVAGTESRSSGPKTRREGTFLREIDYQCHQSCYKVPPQHDGYKYTGESLQLRELVQCFLALLLFIR